ncbi:MAG: protoporphyrinogen oxidase [Phycisphaerae bacterium]|nr:protoporphyrinogen oxidase [Phycisphaerae bacterium]MDW8261294.1 protoporphyrinogen oxidase [Phycisphaerales bacterium]
MAAGTEQCMPSDAASEVSRRGRVLVVGGGIAGLAAAWHVSNAGLEVKLLEASERVGGKLYSEWIDGCLLESGADGFLLRKPSARRLVSELGMDGQVVHAAQLKVSTYVLHRGRPIPLPAGFSLLAPTRWWPFFLSPLLSFGGKLRVAAETILARRSDDADETVADFVRRRFGSELLERVAEPMLSGVFNAPAAQQSIRATFPQFPELERCHGSVIRGLRRRARHALPEAPVFFSLRDGTEELARMLAERLGSRIIRRARATVLDRTIDRFRVKTSDGTAHEADAVILTTPADITASMLTLLAPAAAERLRRIRFAGIGSVYLAYPRDNVSHPLDAYGLVIPAAERRPIDGITFSSSKWPGRAPDGVALLRIFFGGPNTRDAMNLSDSQVVEVARQEAAEILGARGAPNLARVFRWPGGYPQYDLGHVELVDQLERELPSGVYVAGCCYRGVGVPDCVYGAEQAALRAVDYVHALGGSRTATSESRT